VRDDGWGGGALSLPGTLIASRSSNF